MEDTPGDELRGCLNLYFGDIVGGNELPWAHGNGGMLPNDVWLLRNSESLPNFGREAAKTSARGNHL